LARGRRRPTGGRFEWAGEWTVTYETFRDMGAAFVVALVLIYILVVWEFGNFRIPLVIMAPIPLTLLGIIPAHWLAFQLGLRRRVHGDVDDRLDRPGRHHRAQLDPAGGLLHPRGAERACRSPRR
jgi:hypothetical protein